MPAAVVPIHIEQGASYFRVYQYLNPDGTPFDLTDYVASMSIKRQVNVKSVLLHLSVDNGRIEVDPIEGKVIIDLNASDTASLPPGNHVYDILLRKGEDGIRLVKGTVSVEEGITE